MNISLQQLEYIVALDRYRHFVKASEMTFVTQPTLSMQIKKLEDQLGVTLFDRSKQPLVPTDIGKPIIEQARVILNESKKIEAIVQSLQGNIRGEIKMGIIPTLAPYLIPKFTGNFLRKYPDLQLIVREMLTEDIVHELRNETLDLAIIATPIKAKGVMHQVLFYEEIMLYCDSVQKENYLNFNKLPTEKMWLLSHGHCFRNQMINLCNLKERVQEQHFSYESGSLETLKKMVDYEGGATLFPELATMELKGDDLDHLIRIGKNKPFREISMIYTRSQAKTHLLDVIKEEIVSSIPKHMLKKNGQVVEWN